MKLTSLAIVFVVIISPFLFLSGLKTRMLTEDVKLRAFYDQVIDSAVQDAAFVWSDCQRKAAYESDYTLEGSRMLAASTFLDSLFLAFHVYGDQTGMARIKGSVPILVFLEEEGFTNYALTEYIGAEGYRIIDYCWYPRLPYTGAGIPEPYTVRYTLGDTVFIFDRISETEYSGPYSEFTSLIPAFADKGTFETLKLAAISQSVEKSLKAYIARFNSFSMKMGVTYTFHFPRIEDADWKRAISDEGILVFAQGLPVLTGRGYEINAFGGARILRKPTLAAYTHDGKKIYCRESCSLFQNCLQDPVFNLDSLIYYTTAKEAASNGYYPCSLCRP